jgi:hypothetical protein
MQNVFANEPNYNARLQEWEAIVFRNKYRKLEQEALRTKSLDAFHVIKSKAFVMPRGNGELAA